LKKNLIIGTATGYKYADMQYFFTSLKAINFKGDVTILVSDDIDPETKNALTEQGVNLIYVPNSVLKFSKRYANSRLWKIHQLPHKLVYALLNIGSGKLKRLSSYVKKFHLISGSRYCYYYDHLLENRDEYSLIMITDVRDVIFQADPFSEINKESVLNFYAEENSIADSFYTAYWIKHAFGKRALNAVKDKISICSGTTIGSMGRMMDYLEKMIVSQAKITGGLTGLGGFDQGVHNYLVHNNYFPGSKLLKNTEGEVATLGDATPKTLNSNAELIDKQGRVIPVVHQFDRFGDLKLKALS
jgi:hypothetical protein